MNIAMMVADTVKVEQYGLFSVTAVIVLYMSRPEDSESLQSLRAAWRAAHGFGVSLSIVLYDNTPGQRIDTFEDGIEYVAATENNGLAGAYNYALSRAAHHGSQWLLTLDQDTLLPENFLTELGKIAIAVRDDYSVAAIVPAVLSGDRFLSPYWFRAKAIPTWFARGYQGIPKKDIYAFNSAAMMRIAALKQVGGYSPWFWLDNSDAFTFRQLHRHGKRVYVAGQIQVQHNFSMIALGKTISPQRYRNVLEAECGFWGLEMGRLAGLERTARLALRILRHSFGREPPELKALTCKFFLRRVFWSTRESIDAWRKDVLAKFPLLRDSATHASPMSAVPDRACLRPRVSVCMAAYNSAPYIELQLHSILDQLTLGDELIVVDDASQDETVQVIQSIGSPFISLITHSSNQGLLTTIEEAVRNATGEIIFLADGDDIWVECKVSKFLDRFRMDPILQIVTSRVAFIDQNSDPITDDMYRNRKTFHAGFWQNLLRNHFQGSAMAFRASLLGSVLPFPRDGGFLHDHWIGTRTALLGGKSAMVEEPLLLYRRHGCNLSGRLRKSAQLSMRLRLLFAHALAYVRDAL